MLWKLKKIWLDPSRSFFGGRIFRLRLSNSKELNNEEFQVRYVWSWMYSSRNKRCAGRKVSRRSWIMFLLIVERDALRLRVGWGVLAVLVQFRGDLKAGVKGRWADPLAGNMFANLFGWFQAKYVEGEVSSRNPAVFFQSQSFQNQATESENHEKTYKQLIFPSNLSGLRECRFSKKMLHCASSIWELLAFKMVEYN